jgi:hypothetical protein
VHFEPNLGQAPASTRYVATVSGYSLFLSDTGIAMRFPGTRDALRMNLPRARLQAVDLLPGKTSYYFGSGPSDWRTGVLNFGRVRYRSVFPGVDLVVYGKARQVEYDWVVAPGADPGSIRFSFTGGSGVHLDRNGDLVIGTPAGEVRHRSPDIYQRYVGGSAAIRECAE